MEESFIARLPRVLQEEELVSRSILGGEYGEDKSAFLSTRELAEKREISLVTAQRVMVALRDRGLIELRGKKYFLSFGERLQRQKILGLHVPNIENQYFSSLVRVVRKSAAKRGYKLIVAESGYDACAERDILQMFCDLKVMGVLSCPGVVESTHALYKGYPLPLVFLGRKPDGIKGQSVSVNTYRATRGVAYHLIAEHYASFAYIGLNEILKEDMRLDGYRTGLENAGYLLERENILHIGIGQLSKSAELLSEFLKKCQKPIGIFCFHDLLAVEVIRTCHTLKLKIPDEIAVVGFDDLPIASVLVPTLTTVGYRLGEMAAMAVRLLNNQIQNKVMTDINYYIDPTLIVRESSTKKKVEEASSIGLDMQDILCNT